MPRAKIPYDDIERELRTLYPYPLFREIRIRTRFKGDRIGKVTPTTVYDRTSGNFARIGYKVAIEGLRYNGADIHFEPVYINFKEDRVILLS